MPSLSFWLGRMVRQAPFFLVWAVIAVGLTLVGLAYWRRGLTVIAAATLLACVLRLLLPTRRAGWLVVRGRATDVVFYGLLGTLIGALAFTVQAPG